MLTEKREINTNNRQILNVMNNYFTKIAKHLNLKLNIISHLQPLENIIDAFKNLFFWIGIHSMQGWTATRRHGATRKRSTKKIKAYKKPV